MRTFELEKLPSRNFDLGQRFFEDFIYSTNWKPFQSFYSGDHIIFKHNHTFLITDLGEKSIGKWFHKKYNEFTVKLNNHTLDLVLVFADQNLLILQDIKTNKCLLLTNATPKEHIYLNTLDGIIQYVFKEKKEEEKAPIRKEKEKSFNSVKNKQNNLRTRSRNVKAITYNDLSEEEVIYDYLQKQQEQDEEDYLYLHDAL